MAWLYPMAENPMAAWKNPTAAGPHRPQVSLQHEALDLLEQHVIAGDRELD